MRKHASVLGLVVLVGCGSSAGVGDPSTNDGTQGVATPAPAQGGAGTVSPTKPGAASQKPKEDQDQPSDLGAPYPIVLVHGMAGFDQLTVGPLTVDYWNHVHEALAKDGEYEVFETVAPPYDTSEVRAGAIVTQIQDILKRTGRKKVNLVGHSQGGMDSRVLASPNGYAMGNVIATVTTISTPHHGSKVADAVLGLIPGFADSTLNDAASALLGALQKTVYDIQSNADLLSQAKELTTSYADGTFNPKYIDDPNVHYASYAGRTNLRNGTGVCDGGTIPNDPQSLDAAQPIMLPTALLLEDGKGIVNDGLVTVESAKWGEFMQCVPADHLQEIGNINIDGATATTFDYQQFYRDLVKRLRAKGY
jgi:triacylglycerol esterase/lipase EstA (alpha/beta hydrolase family)